MKGVCSPLHSAASWWVPVWSLKAAELWGSLSPPGWAEAPRQVSGLRLTEQLAGEPRRQGNPRDTCCWNIPLQPPWSLGCSRVTEETISRWSARRPQKKHLNQIQYLSLQDASNSFGGCHLLLGVSPDSVPLIWPIRDRADQPEVHP